MTRRFRTQIAHGLSAGLLILVVVHSGSVKRQPNHVRLSSGKVRQIYADIMSREREDRLSGTMRFRYSHWSAEDEFFAQQAKRIREYQRRQLDSPAQIVDALDQGMHAHWLAGEGEAAPVATVIPCRPRLSY